MKGELKTPANRNGDNGFIKETIQGWLRVGAKISSHTARNQNVKTQSEEVQQSENDKWNQMTSQSAKQDWNSVWESCQGLFGVKPDLFDNVKTERYNESYYGKERKLNAGKTAVRNEGERNASTFNPGKTGDQVKLVTTWNGYYVQYCQGETVWRLTGARSTCVSVTTHPPTRGFLRNKPVGTLHYPTGACSILKPKTLRVKFKRV